MRVLITGASGFVGSAVCAALSQRFDVRAVVRRSASNVSLSGQEVVRAELSPATNWASILVGVSVIVHCAARVHVMKETAANPLDEFRLVNVASTLNLASHAANSGVKRFVYISSIGVNGGVTFERAFAPEDEPAPHTPYAVSKCEAEFALRKLARETGLEVVIIRPPMVYGALAPGNFRILIKWLVAGFPLPLGLVDQNRRSFVFVDNLVDLIVTCVAHPAAANQTFLVSDDEDLSTAALLRRMAAALGKPARLIPVPTGFITVLAKLIGRPGIAQRLCGSLQVDISKTKTLLGWSPPVSVDEGLRITAEHWRKSEELRRSAQC